MVTMKVPPAPVYGICVRMCVHMYSCIYMATCTYICRLASTQLVVLPLWSKLHQGRILDHSFPFFWLANVESELTTLQKRCRTLLPRSLNWITLIQQVRLYFHVIIHHICIHMYTILHDHVYSTSKCDVCKVIPVSFYLKALFKF